MVEFDEPAQPARPALAALRFSLLFPAPRCRCRVCCSCCCPQHESVGATTSPNLKTLVPRTSQAPASPFSPRPPIPPSLPRAAPADREEEVFWGVILGNQMNSSLLWFPRRFVSRAALIRSILLLPSSARRSWNTRSHLSPCWATLCPLPAAK